MTTTSTSSTNGTGTTGSANNGNHHNHREKIIIMVPKRQRFSLYQISIVFIGCVSVSFRYGLIISTMMTHRHQQQEQSQQQSHNHNHNANRNSDSDTAITESHYITNTNDSWHSTPSVGDGGDNNHSYYNHSYSTSNHHNHSSACDAWNYQSSLSSVELERYRKRNRLIQIPTTHSNTSQQPNDVMVNKHRHRSTTITNSKKRNIVVPQPQQYYEAMVHPSLLIHPNPSRIAIMIPDGTIDDDDDHDHDDSTIINQILQQIVRHHPVQIIYCFIIPTTHTADISSNVTTTTTRIRRQQQQQQHHHHHHVNTNDTTSTSNTTIQIHFIPTNDPISYLQQHSSITLDIIFVDATTTTTYVNITDPTVLRVMDTVLGECGLLVCHVGPVETMRNLPLWYLRNNHNHNNNDTMMMIRANDRNRWMVLIDTIIQHHQQQETTTTTTNGFQNIVDYNEQNHKFVISMKCRQCRSNWIWNEAEFQIQIAKQMTFRGGRFWSSSSNTTSSIPNDDDMLHFDAATMMQYQFPSRIVEEVWCRNEQEEDDDVNEALCQGHGYDPEIVNVPLSALFVGTSLVANGGRGVFTTQSIQHGSYMTLDDCVERLIIPIPAIDLIFTASYAMENISNFWEVVGDGFLDGYGWSESYLGGPPVGGVDTSISTFINHGCQGSYNVGMKLDYHEMNIMECTDSDTGQQISCMTCFDKSVDVYHPYYERQYPMQECQTLVANRDIDVGEEILEEYMCMGGTDYLLESISDLQHVCSGGLGFVSQYEDEVLISSPL